MAKEFVFKGKNMVDLKAMKIDDFIAMLPSRQKRSFKRGWTVEQKSFLKQLQNEKKQVVKTHCRDMIVLPEMVERKIAVYNGKEFVYLTITPEMVGHYLGEFALTRKGVKHSAAGIGATRGTKFISVK